MKQTQTSNHWRSSILPLRNLAVLGAFAVSTAVVATTAFADTEYEWDPNWGVHEEEWYDPSDWFNDDDGKVDIEDTSGYDDSNYGDNFWSGYDYYGDYSYDYYDPVVTGYDYYYMWTPVDNDWTEVKGDKSQSDKMRGEAKEKSKDKKKQDITKKDVVTMKGTITGVTQTKVKGGQNKHHFVQIETAKGKSVLVDFGPKATPSKVNLKKGTEIQVTGPRAKLNGKYVLVAQQVSAINADKTDKKK